MQLARLQFYCKKKFLGKLGKLSCDISQGFVVLQAVLEL